MANVCNHINPLSHSGTSRTGRVLAALSPASAPIDGRSYRDLILFAKQYARQLQYYDLADTRQGDWQPLMQMDITVVLATLAGDQMPLYETYRTGLYTMILDLDPGDTPNLAAHEALAKKLLEAVFDLLFSYIYHLDAEARLLPADCEERQYIGGIIRGKLKDAALHLQSYYQEVKTAALVDDSVRYIPPELSAPGVVGSAKDLLSQPLGADWQGIPSPVPELSGSGVIVGVKNLVTHNLFNAVVEAILKSIGAVSAYADTRLGEALTSLPTHTPHYALFLTFIQLFGRAQDVLNGLTEKHLQFYYTGVLRLQNSPALDDRAHLVIQLQKNTPRLVIPAHTAFKAGKDADGKEIFFATSRDFTLSQASVKSISALYVDAGQDDTFGAYQTLFLSPLAGSGDGAGAPLTTTDESWFPFGNPKTTEKLAETGFAIASEQLYLREGTRTLTIQVNFGGNLALTSAQLLNAFVVRLTGEKAWYTVDPAAITAKASGSTLTLVLALLPGAPAIVGFDAKIHPGVFDTELPMMEVILQMSKNKYNPLVRLSALKVTGIQLTVQVQGLKKLQVSTDTGAVDPSKPFMPFTASPHPGSAFLIGSKEIFGKPISDLEVLIEWDKLPPEGLDIYEKKNDVIYSGINLSDAIDADANAAEDVNKYFGERVTFEVGDITRNIYFRKHTVRTSWLQDGVWVIEPATRGLFSGRTLFSSGDFRASWLRPPLKYAQTVNLSGAEVWQNNFDFISCPLARFQPRTFNSHEDEKFSIDTKNGFLKLSLSGDDFAHDEYLKQILNVTITTDGNTQRVDNRPDPPYTPLVKSLEINYTSTASLAPASGESRQAFYQIYPFGIQRQESFPFFLVPPYEYEGELYLGLDGLQAPQSISVLFQVSEGSANPLSQRQPLIWSYLSRANRWTPLDSHAISDYTDGLLISGLIIFSLPADAASTALLMGGTLTWIRASVAHDPKAICKIISVQSQAIEVMRSDIQKPGNDYTAPVPANTISKLVVSSPVIKKIAQPYSSFGGRPRESDSDFYVRVSERLRHKGRGITIWDYEHLVLQQFPEIYKVKCLNHTGLRAAQGSAPASINEAWPGHVTVVTVPKLSGSGAGDPLLPYTPLGTLSAVRQYLEPLLSPFVQLDVLNPQFEQVQFDFKVRFLAGYDVKTYGELLQKAIEAFLSPWAFDGGADIEFQGKLSKFVVLKFVEDQYYVDYVSCFKMNHWIDLDAGTVDYDVEEALATTSRSILVSFHNPDTGEKHLINPIVTETATCDCP